MTTFERWVRPRCRKLSRLERTPRLFLELLEDRSLPSVSPFYPVDGSGNNLVHTDWGSVGVDLLRTAPAQYGHGISTLAGATRPSPRLISDVLVTDPGASSSTTTST